jgi:hypothetical protein
MTRWWVDEPDSPNAPWHHLTINVHAIVASEHQGRRTTINFAGSCSNFFAAFPIASRSSAASTSPKPWSLAFVAPLCFPAGARPASQPPTAILRCR